MKSNLYNQNLYELWMENRNKIIMISLVFITIIILLFSIKLAPSINYTSLENKLISDTKKYLLDNNINITTNTYIDIFRLESNGFAIIQNFNGECSLGSGVLIEVNNKDLNYTPYLMCKDYQSPSITEITSNNNQNVKLLGEKMIVISQTEDYIDPGYEQTDNVKVEVSNNLENEPGIYLSNYIIKNNNEVIDILKRIIVVTSYSDYQDEEGLFISLVGDNGITISQGDTYIDQGAIAIDKHDGNITNNININNNLNSNVPGSYSISYDILNSMGRKISIERTINVTAKNSDLNISSSLSPSTPTNQDVIINISIQGDDYYRTFLPNNQYTYARNISYKTSNNGIYNFIFYTKNDTSERKTITVTNIDKESPKGSCSGTISSGKTSLNITSNDPNVSGYVYKIGTYTSPKTTDKTYTFNVESPYASVNIYDEVGNYTNIICQLVNNNPNQPNNPDNPNEPTNPDEPYTPTKPGEFTQNHFTSTSYGRYGFWLYVPESAATGKKMPLVIFLHGSGECGSNLNDITSVGLMKYIKNGYQFDAIIAAPQNPKNVAWKHRTSVVKDLIEHLSKNYNIDPNRISITGHSSGAIGAYTFAAKYPNLLSCIVPVSGYASTSIDSMAPSLVSTPIRAYHGDLDHSVSYSADKALIERVNQLGGNATLITLTGKGHAIPNEVYQDKSIINWMISQRK